jgi:hypothetical protein
VDDPEEPQEKKEQILKIVDYPLQSLALLDVDVPVLSPVMKKKSSGAVRFGHAEKPKKKIGGRMPAFPADPMKRQSLFDKGTAIQPIDDIVIMEPQ